ncbi:hypothetical protein LTR85_005731 [Meristemomyces frigidus]|nr:hypothetical protein LTR85_005731 [Meristemomyces frigidus]
MASISGTWTELATAEQLQRSSHSVSAVGSTLYVFGGELKPRQPRDNEVHIVHINAATNEPTPNVASHQYRDGPSPRVGSASTTLGGKVYLFSGRGGEAMAPVDEKGHLWKLEPRHDLSSRRLPGERPTGDLWTFNLTTKEWQERKAAPEPQRGGPSIAFVNDKLYRMGGFDGKTEQGGAVDVYEPETDEWSTVRYDADGETGPGARSVAALLPISIDGEEHLVSMFGESDPSSLGHLGAGMMLGDSWAWSIDGKAWKRIDASKSPPPRGWFDADVVTIGGKQSIAVAGGLADSNERLSDLWLLGF